MTLEMLSALERILCIFAAAFFGYLGYRLYLAGLTTGQVKVEGKSKLGQFAISGTGPGLLFMAFGGIVVVYALMTSGIVVTSTKSITPGEATAPNSTLPATVPHAAAEVQRSSAATSAPARVITRNPASSPEARAGSPTVVETYSAASSAPARTK